jgi:hypothetical protein
MANDSEKQALEYDKGEIEEILRRVDCLPIVASHSPDEILGYDEHGIPQSASGHQLLIARLFP